MTKRRNSTVAGAIPLGRRAVSRLCAVAIALVGSVSGTQDAVGNGDTRTLHILHEHTKEGGSITYRRNGYYDPTALKQLNWLLRDWRLDQATQMDPKLFDIAWQVYREVGAREPIRVVSAYRSPETNAALRRRSRAVAEHSQHMRGKAMDFYIPEVSMSRVRETAMRLQNGGVGFYPRSLHAFVHLDAGSVRSWPRMSHGELARLFPDGRTVHIPKNGKPLPGYEEAKAQILARGGSVAGFATYAEAEQGRPRKSLWATLFGGDDEDEDSDFFRSAPARPARTVTAAPTRTASTAAYYPAGNGDDAGARSFFTAQAAPAEEPMAPPAPAPALAPPAAEEAATPVPLPPRRPGELTVAALPAAARPVPALRPETRSTETRSPPRASAPAVPADDRAALKSLFEAALTRTAPARPADVATSRAKIQPVAPAASVTEPGPKLRMTFSSGPGREPGPTGFKGPAVAPLPTFR